MINISYTYIMIIYSSIQPFNRLNQTNCETLREMCRIRQYAEIFRLWLYSCIICGNGIEKNWSIRKTTRNIAQSISWETFRYVLSTLITWKNIHLCKNNWCLRRLAAAISRTTKPSSAQTIKELGFWRGKYICFCNRKKKHEFKGLNN